MEFIRLLRKVIPEIDRKYGLMRLIEPSNLNGDFNELREKINNILDGIINSIKDLQENVKNQEETKQLVISAEPLVDHFRSMRFLKKTHEDYMKLSEEERKKLHDLMAVFHSLTEMYKANREQKNIFNKPYNSYSEFDTKIAQSKEFEKELMALSDLIKYLKHYEEGIHEERKLVEDLLKELKERMDIKKDIVIAIEKDEETMENNLLETIGLEAAERRGIKLINRDSTKAIFEDFGNFYFHLESGDCYDVYWDTIPIIRKETLLLFQLVIKRWKEKSIRVFGRPVVLSVTSISRSAEVQEVMYNESPYAVLPERSNHVRGLAIDIGLNDTVRRMQKDGFDVSDIEGIKRKIVEILDECVIDLREKKGVKLVTTFVESHGCYHMSVSPDIVDFQNMLN